MDRPGSGTATLRVAITATGAPALGIAVNGRPAGTLKLGRPEGAITRHQIYGKWYEVALPFDGGLLKRGENELTITVPAGPLNAGVVYDYLRLELDAKQPFAPTTPVAAASTPTSGPAQPAAAPATREPWPFAMRASAVAGGVRFRTAEGKEPATRLLAANWAGKPGETDLTALASAEGGLADWAPSRDGRRVALGIVGGDGFQTVRIVDASRGLLPDRLRWVKDSRLDWMPDGERLLYSGYGEPPTDPFLREFGVHHALYRHRIGTAQDSDEAVYFGDRARAMHRGAVSEDGAWIVVTSSLPNEGGEAVTLIEANAAKPGPWQPVAAWTDRWRFAGAQGSTFYFATDAGAPRRRVVAIDISGPANAMREIVAQSPDLLLGAHRAGDRLLLDYAAPGQPRRREIPLSRTAAAR
jgi:hypothetical protein